jgi:protease-4
MTTTFRSAALAAAFAAAALAGSAHAGSVPSYYDHLNFNLTSPTAFTHAAGGYANPSVYGVMPGAEAEFYWSDYEESGLDHWGLFLGMKYLGFGVVHTRVPDGTDHASVTDYRVGAGFGTRAFSAGLGYGWSGGEEKAFDREDVAQLALTWRFNRYLSLGAAENWGVSTGDRAEIFDVAVRPIGDDRLTVFGDVEARVVNDDYADDPRWSAGAMLEIPAGLKLIGRWYNDDAGNGDGFSVAVAYSLGGGFGGGVPRASGQFFFDDDSNHALTNWGVRLGYPEKSELMKSLQKKGYVEMAIKGRVAYSTYRFFDTRPTLSNILDAINDAREDDRVAGIALNLSGAALSRGQAWEIRERLGEFRSVGKKVVIFVDECDLTTYYVASIADRVVMDPEGMMMLPGYVIGRTYIAGMLEKIGVGFEEWRFLKYKSAVETLSRTDMSEGDREQRQALVDGYYTTFRDDVAEGRGVEGATVDRWVDEVTLFTAQKALDEKLVDELGRWEEVKEAVKKMEGDKRVPMVAPGMVEDRWYPSKQWGTVPQVAVVYAVGPCDMDSGINARRLEKILRGLRENRDVKAIVLRVDSPGGSALASDIVANQLKRCMEKKPVVISQGDVAASGGYWLSMCSNKILAQPTTVTGSIGVISGWAWDKGIGEKLGMEGDHVQRGKHADLFFSLRPPMLPVAIPYRTVTDEERETIITGMKDMYAQFVAAVAKNRRMEEAKVEAIAQGRVWTGLAAQENGLIDRIGGLSDAIEVARELARIGTEAEIDVVEFAPRGLFKMDLPTPSLRAPFAGLGILAMTDFGAALAWSGFGGDDDAAMEDDTAWLDDYELSYLRQLVRHNGRAQVMLPPDFLPRAGAGMPLFEENADN